MEYKLLWIRHAESISNVYKYKFNIHPFLTYKGLLESINLGKYLLEVKVDKVYSSPFIRTILTSLISVTIYNLENEKKIKKIKIIPYISEISPIIYYLGKNNNKYINKFNNFTLKYDNQNNIQDYKDLIELSKISIEWLNSNIICFLLKDKIISLLEKNGVEKVEINKIEKYNNEIKLKKKILEIIKSNNLENKEEIINLINLQLNFNLLDFTDMKKFNKLKYDEYNIYNYLNENKSNILDYQTILLFSHKYCINKITKNNLNFNNCDIYKENILLNKNNVIKISKKIIKFNNFEKNNFEKNYIIIKTIQNKINNIIDNK